MSNPKIAFLKEYADVKAIESHIGATVDEVTTLKKGHLNKKFLLTSDKNQYILKVFSEHLSFVSQRLNAEGRASAEYEGLKLCESTNMDAPRPIALLRKAVLMTKLKGRDLTDLPLRRDLISVIISWLIKFHSIQIPRGFRDIGLLNAPLVAAFSHLRKYISNNQGNTMVLGLEELLSETSCSLENPEVCLRGDPTLGNWFIQRDQVFGLDFEFCSMGSPVFDIGLLVASILDHGKFSENAYALSRYAIEQYSGLGSSLSLKDIRLATLCGLILIALSVPSVQRRYTVLNHTRKSLYRIERFKGD